MVKKQSKPDDGVSQRAQQLFKLLVERYLHDGAPVASRTLALQPGVEVSSATVRNIMAELEARGMVASPHTSAGRVPTTLGLRFFVDSLLSVQPIDPESLERLEAELHPDLTQARLVEQASALLAGITQMAGLVTLPKTDQTFLRHVEFLPLSGHRVLVILVLNERDVQNRVIRTDREYSESELVSAANRLNDEFAGRPLGEVRDALIESMRRDKERMDQLMQLTLDLAAKALIDDAESGAIDYVIAGESNLLAAQPDVRLLRRLFDAFAEKRDLLDLLDRCLEAEGVHLFIGRESGYRLLDELSLVTAPYRVQGRVAGVLGVIGPTRMAYQQVIPVVDVTARLLSAAMR
jgi:heat-inducible transcriptional repressor